MPTVVVRAEYPGVSRHTLFEQVADFSRYPQIADSVREVKVSRTGEGFVLSEWEVEFRRGLLRWTEHDEIDHERCVLSFEQIAGDLAAFTGVWSVAEIPGGASITFEAYFDLGMPTLADMLDPVAERALRSNTAELMAAFARAANTPEARPNSQPA